MVDDVSVERQSGVANGIGCSWFRYRDGRNKCWASRACHWSRMETRLAMSSTREGNGVAVRPHLDRGSCGNRTFACNCSEYDWFSLVQSNAGIILPISSCYFQLSVWGGPLRLQAVAQHHGENPKHVMRRIVSSPIKWIRELEEWKHFSSLSNFGQRNKTGKDRSRGGEGVFNPDPILFPATWLPLRWLQIFAVTKAFATDPLQYRWCSPENDKVVIPRLMKQYLVQLALGDEWHRVFLGEKRVGLGILVVFSYFVGELFDLLACTIFMLVSNKAFDGINTALSSNVNIPSRTALVWMVFTTFTLDGGAAAMLIPSILAALISGLMNLMIFWNRLGTKEQRKALNAMGLA